MSHLSDYAAEKLWAAVDMLDGDGDVRDRLTHAVTGALIRLTPDDFDDIDDRTEFEFVMERLRRFEAVQDEGDVAASAQLMTEAEATDLADTIRALQRRHPMDLD